ncbi:MAG: EthD domain-containing protein [Terriglobales bacterium]
MFKTLWLLKRKEGMSKADFIDYYENKHSKLVKYAIGARHYVRRYVTPLYSAPECADEDLGFDVVMELWFDDRAAFEAAMVNLSRPEIAAEIKADEEKLFDRSRIRAVYVEEHETPLAAGSPAT